MERPARLLLLRPPGWLSREVFRSTVLDHIAPRLLDAEGAPLTLTITTAHLPPRLTVIPFRREPVALITLPGCERPSEELARLGGFPGWRLSDYRAMESRPVEYLRDWPAGEPTPGVGLLTLFRRRPGLDARTFIDRWHGSHTPLSLEIHPLWSYLRYVVASCERNGDSGAPWEGIVEEHFRRRADLLDPRRFFGGAARMLPNMARVAYDVARFLDLRTLRSYLVEEIHLG